MKVTYLDNSGFMVTTEKFILVFDFYRDPSRALHHTLERNPELPVIFLVSHKHDDHYNPGIYEMAQGHRRVYIVSNDIPAMKIPSTLEVQGMSPGDSVENLPGGVAVKAYGSTDEGVSYRVTLPCGRTIFHGGDLNDWHWQDEATFKEVEKAHTDFEKVIHRIKEENDGFFIAMFAVDPRLGSDYARGAREFLQTFKVDNFFPMHFQGKEKEACDFATYATTAGATHCLAHPGNNVDLDCSCPL